MKKLLYTLLILLCTSAYDHAYAQQDSTGHFFQYKIYTELYYGLDFPYNSTHNRPPYIYSYNRSRELTLNLALASAQWDDGVFRAGLGLMAGTYVQQNLAAEPALLQPVYEARLGLALSKKHNWWLDAGIFPSHIGFESAIGLDCANLTRSILADNSPYYEAGVKSTYGSTNGHWAISLLLLNGWQRIKRADGNKGISFGHQVQWTPSTKWLINSSSYVGNDQPDSARAMRYFHNLYIQYNPSGRWAFTAGFDLGGQETSVADKSLQTWYAFAGILQWKTGSKLTLAARIEYYRDIHGVIIPKDRPSGTRLTGISCNADWKLHPRLTWRTEYRLLSDPSSTPESLMTSSLAFFLKN